MNGFIFFGDFQDIEKLELIKPESIDLILTDPPYIFKVGSSKYYRTGVKGNYENYLDFMRKFFQQAYKFLKPTGNLAVFHIYNMIPTLLCASYPVGFRLHKYFVWIKENQSGGLGRNSIGNESSFKTAIEFITFFRKGKNKPYYDPYSILELTPSGKAFNYWIGNKEKDGINFTGAKPKELLRIFVRALSPPGGIVYDPFLGSGSIIPVCIEENRFIIGCEIDKKAQEIIKHRISQYPYAKIEIYENKKEV